MRVIDENVRGDLHAYLAELVGHWEVKHIALAVQMIMFILHALYHGQLQSVNCW